MIASSRCRGVGFTGPMRLSPPHRPCSPHLYGSDDVPRARFCSNPTDGCIIGYLPASCVRLLCMLLLMFYRWYVNGFDRSWPKRVHGGILYSMNDGFVRWRGLNRSITYNAPDRIMHAPFLAYFDYQGEMMQYIQMKCYAGNLRKRIANIDTIY